MCGIAGFFGPYGEQQLGAMTSLLAHRGPDDSGHFLGPPNEAGMRIGLGHRRLSIIDLEGGHQPLWSTDRTVGIVFNGEIYNYAALRAELTRLGRPFATHSDTEVIVQGWMTWGAGVLARLEGMFAFAIWDTRDGTLFLARDRLGIKPLYYCRPAAGGIAFASEIKPLLPFVGGSQAHPEALVDYLLHGWTAGEETIFRGIFQLPPAHTLHLRSGDAASRPTRYWALSPRVAGADDVAELTAAFDAAVASHMVADVPVGLTLSGGLDSSAVLASMATRTAPSMLRAFCVGYGLPDDELPYARAAAAHCGVRLEERLLSHEGFAETFAQCLWHLEEPIAHPVMQTTFELARFVREQGKVVLIGEGSDELFAGYPEFRLFTPPFAFAPPALRRRAFMAVLCLMPPPRTLRGMLAGPLRGSDRMDALAARFDAYFDQRPQSDGALRFELETTLPFNQLARVDKLTMAHSIEARVPFLDHRLVELAAGIPFARKLRHGTGKRILREAMAGRLPPRIVDRPKSGKGGTQALLPSLLAMARSGPLRELIGREAIGARGWLDPDAVHRYLAQESSWYVRRHPIERRRRAKFAFALAALEQWARLYLD